MNSYKEFIKEQVQRNREVCPRKISSVVNYSDGSAVVNLLCGHKRYYLPTQTAPSCYAHCGECYKEVNGHGVKE